MKPGHREVSGRAPEVERRHELAFASRLCPGTPTSPDRTTAYRCFLSDLTGFTAGRRAGPKLHHCLASVVLMSPPSTQEFNPATADCGYKAPLAPRLARPSITLPPARSSRRQSKLIALVRGATARTNRSSQCESSRSAAPCPVPTSTITRLPTRPRFSITTHASLTRNRSPSRSRGLRPRRLM